VVLVDAVVTGKKGEYIHDLTAKDFRVWEDNKEQTIQSFSLESGAKSQAAELKTTYLVLVFDYSGMDAGDQIRARQAGARFIDANTGPDRQMAVAAFDSGFHILQGFTGNAGRLKDAITGDKSFAAAVNNATSGTSAATDLSGRDKFRSLQELADNLGSVPGRKTMVFLTGSLTLSNEQKAPLQAAIEALNRSNVAVYPVDVRDPSLAASFSAENGSSGRGGRGGGGGVGGARGGGASRGMRGDEDPSAAQDPGGTSQQVLFALATGTGGFVIRNAGELPGGLQKIGQEQDEYYVIGYTPLAGIKGDSKEGSCHTLRVKVDRGGATVRARSSYCTGKTQDLLTGTSAERTLESRAAAAQPGNMAASIQLPYFYVGPNTARVNLAMEISPETVKFEHKKDAFHAEVNVLGIATSSQEEGETGARFSDTLNLDFDEAEMQKWKQRPLHYEKEFKIAPGQYKLTVVFSSGGESFGKVERPLTIEPYQPGQFAISGVAFGKEIHKADDVSTALFEDKTPLVTKGIQLTPAGTNVFTKPEQAFCYFEVYPQDPANPGVVQVRILDGKTGAVKWDGGAIKLDLLGTGKSAIPIGLSLPIDSLPPGPYRVEIAGTDNAGKSVQRTADFELK
jgi:VWFA-related protein